MQQASKDRKGIFSSLQVSRSFHNILAVPSIAVFWICSAFIFIPIFSIYLSMFFVIVPRAPTTEERSCLGVIIVIFMKHLVFYTCHLTNFIIVIDIIIIIIIIIIIMILSFTAMFSCGLYLIFPWKPATNGVSAFQTSFQYSCCSKQCRLLEKVYFHMYVQFFNPVIKFPTNCSQCIYYN